MTSGSSARRLLYPDGRIQFAGTVRNLDAPEWFDHRYRFKPADWGPARRPVTCAGGDRRLHVRHARRRSSASGCSTSATRWHTRTSTGACVPGRRVCASCTSRPRCLDPPRVGHARNGGRRARARVPAGLLGALGRVLRCARGAHDPMAGCGSSTSPRAPASAAATATSSSTSTACSTAATMSRCYTLGEPPDWFALRAPVHSFEYYEELVEALAGARRDQGGDVVEHRGAGVAGERSARDPRVLRAGHRDELLPRRRAHPPRGDRLLPPGVPLHDDLLVEPRASARARPGRRADPAGDRSGHVPPAAGRSSAAATWCSRSGAPTR